jgi:hypothetical protein
MRGGTSVGETPTAVTSVMSGYSDSEVNDAGDALEQLGRSSA